MDKNQNEENTFVEEKPPLVKNWKWLYLIVFLFLILQVVLYYLFTKFFS